MLLVETKATIKDGKEIANYEILSEIAKIFNNTDEFFFEGKPAVQQTSKYRSGSAAAPQSTGFYDEKIKTAFNRRYEDKKEYAKLVERVDKFYSEYLFIDEKNPWLVNAIFDMIENDASIDDKDILFVDALGRTISKATLDSCKEVYIPSLILGLFHYTFNKDEIRKKVKDVYSNFTVTNHDNSKSVNRDEFTWHESISIVKDFYYQESESTDNSEADNTRIGVVTTDDDIAPDLGEYDASSDEIVYISAEEANSRIRGDFSKYAEKAYEKYSMATTFVYEIERPFKDFYVCSDIAARVNTTYYSIKGATEVIDGYETPIKNVNICDFNGLKNLIIGKGGLGKSMLMNHLFLTTIDNYERDPYLPIFVTLNDYNPKDKSLLFLLCQAVTRFDTKLKKEDVIDKLEDGGNVLLLDGLDEIEKEYLDDFIKELDYLGDLYQDNAFIVSSRLMPEIRRLKGYKQYNILPLSEEQAFKVVSKIDTISDKIKKNFIRDIKNGRFRLNKKEKEDYLGNPLLLTIMLITYSTTNNISTQKFLFYEDAYRAMATTHDGKKGVTREFFTGYTAREFQGYFGQFCAESYLQNKLKLPQRLMDKYIQKVIDDNNLKTDIDTFRKDIVEKLCLMYLDGTEYRFIHRSFQEYFAAYFFTTLMDDEFSEIYEALVDIDSRIVSDETIGMLYGIDKRKFERFIAIPFLESIFVCNNDEEDYRSFLKKFYPEIGYTTGELDDEMADSDMNSAIYKFITDNYDIKGYVTGMDFDNDEGYADNSEQYYLVDDYRYDYEYGDSKIVDKSGLWAYQDPDGEIHDERIEVREMGYVCTIDIASVCSRLFKDSRWEIINMDSFPLKKEFLDAKELLKTLKEKYAEKNIKKRRFGIELDD